MVSCKNYTYEPLPFNYRHRARAQILPVFCLQQILLVKILLFPAEPISYGRTQQRHITRDLGFLSYPASAIVTVLAKGAYFGENGEEFWEAEVKKKSLVFSGNFF